MKIDFSFKSYSVLLVLMLLSITGIPVNAQIDPDFLWLRNFGGLDYDQANDIAVDNDGNIIITGSFQGNATFGTFQLNSIGFDDIFLVKLDPSGNVLWAVRAGGLEYDEGSAVTTDNNNNIIITGSFSGDAFFGSILLTSSGSSDVFTAKYSSDGIALWAKKGGSSSYDAGFAVTTDNSGNVYTAGTFSRAAQFGLLSGQGGEYSNVFLVKYNSFGDEQWIQTGTGSGFYNNAYGLATNSLNDVIMTGTFSELTTFSGINLNSIAGPDIFLVRYDTNGSLIWINQAGGSSFNEFAQDVAIDKNNDIFLTGGFSETINFGSISLTTIGNSNTFVTKYNLSGVPQWAVQAGGSDYTSGNSLAVDLAGNILVLGSTGQLGLKRGGLDKIQFLKLRSNGQNIWEFTAGSDNGNSAGGIGINNNGEIYVSGSFLGTGIFGSQVVNSSGNFDVFVGKIPAPILNIVTPSIDFGSVAVGNTSNRNVTLSNPSTTRLAVYNLILEGPAANEYTFAGNVSAIQPQQTVDLELTFSPLSPGIKNAIIIIESEATSTPDTVLISGTGGTVSLSLSADTLDFGTLDVNISAELVLTISNTGSQSILISDILITGLNSNEFGLIGQLQDSIPPSDSRNIRVIYTPSSPGSKIAELSILSNSPGSPDNVVLLGNAISAIVVELPVPASLGQNTTLNVTPPEGFEVTSNQFFYKRTGEIEFQSSTMTLSGENFIASIPPAFSTIRGIQYYLEFSDGITIVTFPSNNPQSNPASIPVNISQINYPMALEPSEYSMLSIPLLLSDPSISAVLLDDYGSYDNRIWRILHWDEPSNEYLEFPNLTKDFLPGNGFWLIHRDGRTFNIQNAVSVQSIGDYTVTVNPGWNQIANPFAFPVDWLTIENSQLVDSPVRWNVELLDYEYEQLVLNPWEGYWVFNPTSQNINLFIPPIESSGDSPLHKVPEISSSEEFIIQIRSRLENTKYQDNQNFIGMISAADNKHHKNLLEAPPITNDLRLSIIDNNKKYAKNIVQVNSSGAAWNLALLTTHKNKNVYLDLEDLYGFPEEFQMWLLDLNKQVAVPVQNNIAVLNSGNAEQINLQVIIGTEEFAKHQAGSIQLTPVDYALYQNYPNPFNPSTMIEYNLREKSTVTLEIFDVLGRKIHTLVANEIQNAGRHSILWEGRNLTGKPVSSGVYIYQLRANNFVESRKMILLR